MKLLMMLAHWFFTSKAKRATTENRMSWFEQLCRNTGLMIHHTLNPSKKSDRKEVKRTVEEKQVNSTTTLRRTTIEEIEIREEPKPPFKANE